MELNLEPSERLDDLTGKLKIIQSPEVFSFSMDAVLLAHFATIPKSGLIIDLCSGNGVIPLIMSSFTTANIYGIEIQKRLVNMAIRSVELNNLSRQIKIVQSDLKESPILLGKGKFDLVTVNPPYLPLSGQDKNKNQYVAIARHEIYTNLEEVILTGSQLLKVGGRFSMVHKPSRLVDIIYLLREAKIEPKRIRYVHPASHNEANMVLIEGTKNGGKEVRILPPLIVYDENGKYTDEIYKIYFSESYE